MRNLLRVKANIHEAAWLFQQNHLMCIGMIDPGNKLPEIDTSSISGISRVKYGFHLS